MSDCVYLAFAEYLQALGMEAKALDRRSFDFWRWFLQGGYGPLHISVAPYVVNKLARHHGYEVMVQSGFNMSPSHWRAAAPTFQARLAARYYERGETVSRQADLGPAIYGAWSMNHAIYAERPPTEDTVVAIKISEVR